MKKYILSVLLLTCISAQALWFTYDGLQDRPQGGSGAFGPADLAGDTIWLDATDNATLGVTNNYIGQWQDKATEGNFDDHFFQGAEASAFYLATNVAWNNQQIACGSLLYGPNNGAYAETTNNISTDSYSSSNGFCGILVSTLGGGGDKAAVAKNSGSNYDILITPKDADQWKIYDGGNYRDGGVGSYLGEITNATAYFFNYRPGVGMIYWTNGVPNSTNASYSLPGNDQYNMTLGARSGGANKWIGCIGEYIWCTQQQSDVDLTALWDEYLKPKWVGE